MDREPGGPSAEPADEVRSSYRSIARDAELIGRTLGDFVVIEKIGEGGFGAVYRAHQPLLDRSAVIKVLHTRLRATASATERFLREARLASRLDHPFAAHIYAFGAESDGTLWIAMELVRGTTLSEYLRVHGPLGVEKFVPLLERICEVVHSAHEQGIIHRDLKPANVMVMARAGRLLPKLLDFGIAKSLLDASEAADEEQDDRVVAAHIPDVSVGLDDTLASDTHATRLGARSQRRPRDVAVPSKLTQRGAVMGSPHYMAPEQWQDATSVTARTDLYALGVLAFEALTGAPPFRGSSTSVLASAHVTDPVPPLPPHLPATLNSAMARALAKRPEDRFDTAIEMATAFRAASGLAGEKRPLPQLEVGIRDRYLADAPQPIAEAVAALDAARDARQARDALWTIPNVLGRWLAVVALAARSRLGPSHDGPSALATVRELATTVPGDDTWIEAAVSILRGYASQPDLHPLPELVMFACEPGNEPGEGLRLYRELLALRPASLDATASEDEVIDRLQPAFVLLTRLLRRAELVCNYTLVVSGGDGFAERWSGTRRVQRAQAVVRGTLQPDTGIPILIDREGVPVVALHPLVQVAEPAAGVGAEPFLFAGHDRRGAKLVAVPAAFELHDAQVLDWLRVQMASTLDPEHGLGVGERPPYLGLSAFTAEDAALYVGREQVVDAFVNRLRVESLVAVVGPSGAGKSSFVQAGVIPALGAEWRAIIVRPGPAPLATFASRIAAAGIRATDLATRLRTDPSALGTLLRDDASEKGPIVLVIDQLEELFTNVSDEAEQQAFADAIASAARGIDDPVRVILTVRDDFLVAAQALESLHHRFARGLQLLTTPSRADLERIVVEPARRVGYEFEDPALPARMVAEVAGRPGALALLSFTAAQLWEHRDRHFRRLPTKAYEQLGGVGGALARHADNVLANAPVHEQRLMREAFRHLVTSEGTRAVMSHDELAAVMGGGSTAHDAIERLIASRLLIAREGEDEQQIEIAHEALVEAWPRLAEWRREDVEGARLRDQLRAAARHWESGGRPRGLLWRGDVLAELELWRRRGAYNLTEVEFAFANTSRRDAARGRRLRGGSVIAAFALLTAGLIVLFSLRERADDARGVAERERQRARAQLVESYTENGRRALLEGDGKSALVYFAEVLRLGADSPALRFMIARAMDPLDAEVATLRGHSDRVWSVEIAPDGKRVLTAGMDGTARVWDAASGKELRRIDLAAGMVAAAWSPDGAEIATVDSGGRVQVWSAEGLVPRVELSLPPPFRFPLVRFCRDGRHLVVAALREARFVIADVTRSGGRIDVTTGEPVYGIDCSHDATRVIAAGPHGATVWNAKGERVATVTGHTESVWFASFSPDDKLIATGSIDGTARVSDAITGMTRFVVRHERRVTHVAFSPSGHLLATAGADRVAKLTSTQTGELAFTLSGHSAQLNRVAFTPDGKSLVTVAGDGTARIWDTRLGIELGTFEHDGFVFDASVSADGTRVATASWDGTARVFSLQVHRRTAAWFSTQPVELPVVVELTSSNVLRIVDKNAHWIDLATGATSTLVGPVPFASADTTSEGSFTALLGDDGVVRLYDSGRQVLAEIDANALDVSIAGSRVVTLGRDRTLASWDATGRPSGRSHLDSLATRIAASPDGKLLLLYSDSQLDQPVPAPLLVESQALTTIARLGGEETLAPPAISFSADGQLIAIAPRSGTQVWSSSGTLVRRLEDVAIPYALEFSPDGKRLVVGLEDGSMSSWSTIDWSQQQHWKAHDNFVRSVAHSPDGVLLASSGGDGAVRVWDVRRTRELFRAASPGLSAVRFDADERLIDSGTLATRGAGPGYVDVWRMTRYRGGSRELDGIAKCRLGYELSDGRVVARAPGASCD